MPFQSLLAADRIVLLVEPGDRDAVLDAAARLLGDGSTTTTQAIADSLRKRERLGSTGIGHGIAIPHGRTAAFDEARGAFLRLCEPVAFGASDGEPVDLVFAMAVPEHFTQQHLQLLAKPLTCCQHGPGKRRERRMPVHQLANAARKGARRCRADLQSKATQHPAQAHLHVVVLGLQQLAPGQ